MCSASWQHSALPGMAAGWCGWRRMARRARRHGRSLGGCRACGACTRILCAREDTGVFRNPVPGSLAARRPGARRGRGGVPLIRRPRTLPRVLAPAEVDALRAALRTHRDRAMVDAAEDQPDLALEGRLPGLLAAAVRPARTRLTSHPVPATRKEAAPARSEPVPPRAHRAAPPPASHLPLPKTGATRSVRDLAGTLNHRG